ncbi:MAG: hypothetical protein FWF32_07475, partial [Endomicrobia bacterium]|nr:hypothetical protein [Endomicrobiia bacterium]
MSVKKTKSLEEKSKALSAVESPKSYADYFQSDEYMSSSFSSAVSATILERIIGGGKKVVHVTALAAILYNNFVPYAQAQWNPNINSGVSSTGETILVGSQNVNFGGSTNSANVRSGGSQIVSGGGRTTSTLVSTGGQQNILT